MRASLTVRFWIMIAGVLILGVSGLYAGLSGAIFTTNSQCDGTNINIFNSKEDVYLDGGPTHSGAAGLPDGFYYVQVTEPDGTLLGTSVGDTDETPIEVVGGEFAACYSLYDIVGGYATTSNPGGEYKVWIGADALFVQSKTDNFKVRNGGVPPQELDPVLQVSKFYDTDADGVWDPEETVLVGWEVVVEDGMTETLCTEDPYVESIFAPDTYWVTESMPFETNWVATTDTSVQVTLDLDQTEYVEFGNVCLGGGGGHTIGYWRNKSGKNTFSNWAPVLAQLSALNLRNKAGANFDPANYSSLASWLQAAEATNMAYMLSAQLAAMKLNVLAGYVDGGALVYSPDLGFVSIAQLMNDANASLGSYGLTLAGHPQRSHQQQLKNALDAANNNQNFVQAEPCPYTFSNCG